MKDDGAMDIAIKFGPREPRARIALTEKIRAYRDRRAAEAASPPAALTGPELADLIGNTMGNAIDLLDRVLARNRWLEAASPAAGWRDDLRKFVGDQANDPGLWFLARTASEAYLQQELRKLHDRIEASPASPPTTERDARGG